MGSGLISRRTFAKFETVSGKLDLTPFLITGTDTGAGKTLVGCALVAALRARGLRVSVYKPVETGCAEVAGQLVGEDCVRLAGAAGDVGRAPEVASYRFALPAAPLVAAEAAGNTIDPQRLVADFARLLDGGTNVVIVEGAGGLMVPIADGFTYLDLARRLDLPILCVVGSRLGCINHALLTLRAIETAGLRSAGYVVNCMDPGEQALAAARSNRATIARFMWA